MLDTLIRGGRLVDGTGAPARTADVAIKDGRIVEVGRVTAPAQRTIEADGLLVTPGFVDIHTHYDGQAMWDDALYPSFDNGVTTAILGNCGVGFAPLRPGGEDMLIDLMDGVEDIPGSALSEGLAWNWESFPEYLDLLGDAEHSFNIGALVAHGPLRVYVLGDKVLQRKCADDTELSTMTRLLDEALAAGAFGLSSSRTPVHRSALGYMTPDYEVDLRELMALGSVVGRHDGIFEFAPAGLVGEDLDSLRRDMGWYERIALDAGARVHMLVSQTHAYPDYWQEQFSAIDRVNVLGGRMHAQVSGRCIGSLLGFENSNPFATRQTYIEVTRLPRERWRTELARPEVRARILAERDNWPERLAIMGTVLPIAYRFGPSQDYEPTDEDRLSVIAEQSGRSIEEVAYDVMLEHDGQGFLYAMFLNYNGGSLDVARDMMRRPASVVAASDAGAHVQSLCDGAINTFMMSFWARDRVRGPRLPVEEIVHMLTAKPAASVGLTDRGIVAPGMAADLNVIDFDRLVALPPRVAADLPSGAIRLIQAAKGYVATIVGGVVTRDEDNDTGARPGRLLRKGA